MKKNDVVLVIELIGVGLFVEISELEVNGFILVLRLMRVISGFVFVNGVDNVWLNGDMLVLFGIVRLLIILESRMLVLFDVVMLVLRFFE